MKCNKISFFIGGNLPIPILYVWKYILLPQLYKILYIEIRSFSFQDI